MINKILSKIFEKILCNKTYTFLRNDQLLNPNQSGFRPSDSCINQSLSTKHEISQSFDTTQPHEVRSVFLDISKAFDKVWHEGLLFKLNSIGISGKFYKLMESYLSNRFQRVVLNAQPSPWRSILAGIYQGSILRSLLFLIYINDMPDDLKSNVKLFANDTSIFSIVKNQNDNAKDLIHNLSLISKQTFQQKMLFNAYPTKPALEVIFSRRKGESAHPHVFLMICQQKELHTKNILKYTLMKI